MDANKVITFPRFRGTNSSPAWSPDGSHLIFSSSMLGNPELFVTDAKWRRSQAPDVRERRQHLTRVESQDRAKRRLRQ